MSPSSPSSASRHLATAEQMWRLWQQGDAIPDLAPELKPATIDDGYAIQGHFDRLSGATRLGWKIAATSEGGQKHIGVSGPLVGRIFASRLYPAGARCTIANNRMRVAEPEFAFRFAHSITPRGEPYSQNEVLDAVSSLHLAIELPDSRFTAFASVGGVTLIADNACAHELVLGPAVTHEWRALDLSRHAVTATVGRRYTRAGSGANVLGDPRHAATWFVNEMSRLGVTVAAGEFVTTGTAVVPLDIAEGDHVVADFGVLGTIDVHIT